MTIDWFTAGAQVINFLVLVYLLKRFLYRPILDAMERRQALISSRLEEATEQSILAAEKISEFETQRAALDARSEQILADAFEQASVERARSKSELRAEIAQKRAGWHEAFERERSKEIVAFREVLTNLVADTARKVIVDVADATLEQCVLSRFLRHLSELPQDERLQLAKVLSDSGELEVESAFVLSAPQRSQLTQTLAGIGESRRTISFRESERLICGVAIQADGRQWAWDMSAYLSEVHSAMTTANEARVG